MADHRVRAQTRVSDMDVPVSALGRAVRPPHVLREDPPRLETPGDVDADVALERRADVVRPHRAPDADRGCLVAPAGIEGAWDLALLVEDVATLLDRARGQHAAEDAEQVLAVETGVFYFLERADRLSFPHGHADVSRRGSWSAALYPLHLPSQSGRQPSRNHLATAGTRRRWLALIETGSRVRLIETMRT